MDNFIIKGISGIFYNCTSGIIITCLGLNLIIFFVINFILHSMKKQTQRDMVYQDDNSKPNVSNLNKDKSSLVIWYAVYSNITAIFPLLGILGTVASLYQDMTNDKMMENFNVALGTTILGVGCAILSKVGDSLIAGRIDNTLEDVESLNHQYNKEKRKENATQEG